MRIMYNQRGELEPDDPWFTSNQGVMTHHLGSYRLCCLFTLIGLTGSLWPEEPGVKIMCWFPQLRESWSSSNCEDSHPNHHRVPCPPPPTNSTLVASSAISLWAKLRAPFQRIPFLCGSQQPVTSPRSDSVISSTWRSTITTAIRSRI